MTQIEKRSASPTLLLCDLWNLGWLTDLRRVSYTYDDTGSLTNDGTYAYTWNAAGRLVQAQSITHTVVYTYNGDGVRRAMAVDGLVTYWTQDTDGLAEVLIEHTPAGATFYLLGLSRLAQIEGSSAEWFLGDGLGSVRQLVDDDGVVVLAQDYDPYGLLLAQDGPGSSGYGFTGEQVDPTGLVYLRARYFHPALGRFLSVDPFPGYAALPASIHPYLYCLDDPVNAVDPSGQQGEPPWVQAIRARVVVDLARASESLKSIADPTRNPRAAANYYAFWNGVSAWGDIRRMYGEMVRYTGAAVLGGCWEDAARGAHGLAEGQSVLLESVAQATGIAVWQIATTPVRIFTTDIPELWAAGRERMQGQGRGWDVVLTANTLAGDVALTAQMIKIGISLHARAVKPNQSTPSMVERNGFKFTKSYYEKLWRTGRKAPSLIAQEILEAKHFEPIPAEVVSRPGQSFHLYRAYSGSGSSGWELVYSLVTHEVYHLQPIADVTKISSFKYITILAP